MMTPRRWVRWKSEQKKDGGNRKEEEDQEERQQANQQERREGERRPRKRRSKKKKRDTLHTHSLTHKQKRKKERSEGGPPSSFDQPNQPAVVWRVCVVTTATDTPTNRTLGPRPQATGQGQKIHTKEKRVERERKRQAHLKPNNKKTNKTNKQEKNKHTNF